MESKMFEQVRKLEDYIAEHMEDTDDALDLIAMSSGYACSYIPFFEEVKTDACDSMMLLKIYLNTLKKIERAIVEASIKEFVETRFKEHKDEE